MKRKDLVDICDNLLMWADEQKFLVKADEDSSQWKIGYLDGVTLTLSWLLDLMQDIDNAE